MTFDKQIITENIDTTGNNIGGKGQSGLSAPSQGGIDGHKDHVENHSSHDNLKVYDRVIKGIFLVCESNHDRTRQRNR